MLEKDYGLFFKNQALCIFIIYISSTMMFSSSGTFIGVFGGIMSILFTLELLKEFIKFLFYDK